MPAPEPTTLDDAAGRVDRLAEEFLQRTSAGEAPDIELLAASLASESEREAFRQLVADAQAVLGLLPVQVCGGRVLGGRFRIVREVGAGGMGKVFEAWDERLERRVAVKVLAVFGTGAFDPEEQFEKEARLLARLSHPHIVPVHEVGRDGDVHYLVMDLVQGIPLDVALAQVRARGGGTARRGDELLAVLGTSPLDGGVSALAGRRWPEAAASLALTLARTVAAAHAEGLVHRDLKPQNVMLRADGSPVVLDFGLAGATDAHGGPITRGLFGSVAYLAPEQARRGSVGADPRTDVYQLGALLYELLTLERAFPGSVVTELLARIGDGDFPRPRSLRADVPWALEAICLKAMQRDPERRYPTAEALCADLERFVSGRRLPLAARGGPLAGVLRDGRFFVRRHRALAGALCAVGLAVALLVVARDGRDVEVTGLRWRPGPQPELSSALPELGADIGRVLPGDVLGVRVASDEPLFVYAVSIWGERSPPTWMAPMVSRVVDDPDRSSSLWDALVRTSDGAGGTIAEDEDEAVADRFGVRVPAGSTLLLCTQVGERRADVPYEGLWIYTSPQRQPHLELWMASLFEDQRTELRAGGVAFVRARELFDAPESVLLGAAGATPTGVPRGVPLELSDTALKRLSQRLSAAAVLGDESARDSDPRRFELAYPVGG